MKPADAERAATGPESGTSPGLAGALHEVSNALTVVLGWLDAARGQVTPGAVREAVDVAYLHARRGHCIARRAIGADVEDAGTTRNAISLARDAILAVTQEAKRRRIDVQVHDDDAADLLIHGAPAAMQILINLLLDAVAFTPEGGRVFLEVRDGRGEVVFDVVDGGSGIPPERAATLFDSAESTRAGGAGIGLRHAYGLARKHGGALTLVDTGPHGSRFSLAWRVGEAPSGTLHRSVPPPAPVSLEGARLLVLEDDSAVLSLIELGLGARGASIAPASSLDDFDRAFDRGLFDAVLVDLSPLGPQPSKTLAAIIERAPTVPIVVISGSAAPEFDTSLVAAWVRKPFEVSELVEALCRVRAG